MSAAYTFDPSVHVLGNPCRRGHTHASTDLCPRFKGKDRKGLMRPGNCIICRAEDRRWLTPEYREWRLSDSNEKGRGERLILHRHIRAICVLTVPDLVRQEQLRYWQQDRSAFWADQFKKRNHRLQLRRMIDPDYRAKLADRQRGRRAAKFAGHAVRVSTIQLGERFGQFGHACAYCGSCGVGLEIDHFLPLSKGGGHMLGNVLPSCRRCNSSKLNHDPELWYRAQPCFTEQRWRTILRVLGKQRGSVGQLSLV